MGSKDSRMGTDPDDAGLLDGLADMPDDPELLAELRRLLKRVQMHAQPSRDEHRDLHCQLDLDNPPAAPEEPLLQIGYVLLTQLPQYWETVFLQVTAAADEVRTLAVVRMQEDDDPLDSRFYFFRDLVEPSLALRRSTYEPAGRGAWYNAHIRLFRDGTIDAKYDYHSPPFGFWGLNEAALVMRGQELCPRAPERLPHWHPAR